MAASGAGRGRGWLNLNKNSSSLPRPGDAPVNVTTNRTTSTVPVNNNHEKIALPNVTKYLPLISQINMLHSKDDGIMLNRKLKKILEVWQEVCLTEKDVEESITCIYQSCLTNKEFISKVIDMITSHTFMSLTIHTRKIRNEFIGLLQTYFETRKEVQQQNIIAFRRSVRILGEFYNKARLCDGSPIQFLVNPLVEYLQMLLEAAELEDLELFTAQLYLNGSSIKSVLPTKLEEILLEVRRLLVSNAQLPNTSKVWLLLAIDVSHCRYGVLPTNIQDFYQEQLGDESMAYFQGSHHTLSVQTLQTSKTLDSFQSSVNVLQVSTPEVSPISDQPALPRSNSFSHYNSATASIASSQSFNASDSGMSIGRWEDDKTNNREKAGRPILGAGARLNKNNVPNDGLSGRDKQYAAWSKGEKKGYVEPRHNKSWEHDDRFENDYN